MDAVALSVWEFDRDISPELAARVAREQLELPDLEVLLVAEDGDEITVEVLEGTLGAPSGLLYVATRGLHDVVRVEKRSPAVPTDVPRVLLTLAPHRP